MAESAKLAQQFVVPLVIAVLAIAVYTDCRWRVIKNMLTLPALALGLCLHYLGDGWPGLVMSLAGCGAGFGLMLIPFMFGQMGAGDVKLMAALGALLGAYPILNVFLYTTLAGGALALAVACYKGEGVKTLQRTWHIAKGLVLFRISAVSTDEPRQPIYLPYGVAIAAGTVTYLLVGSVV